MCYMYLEVMSSRFLQIFCDLENGSRSLVVSVKLKVFRECMLGSNLVSAVQSIQVSQVFILNVVL